MRCAFFQIDWINSWLFQGKTLAFFFKCMMFPAIDCINSQSFSRKNEKIHAFLPICFQNAQYFSQLLAYIYDYFASQWQNSHFFFWWFVFKTDNILCNWLHKFTIISKLNGKIRAFLHGLFPKCTICFLVDWTN